MTQAADPRDGPVDYSGIRIRLWKRTTDSPPGTGGLSRKTERGQRVERSAFLMSLVTASG